jgi:hypothetical protein
MIMSNKSTYPQHSFPQHWSSQDLADAVPQRLSELMTQELGQFDARTDAANGVALSPWAFDWRRRDYLRDTAPSPFRVR